MTGLECTGTGGLSVPEQRNTEVAAFSAWLAAARTSGRRDLATQLYLDYADWLGALERLPKKRQFMRGGFSKQRFAWRRAVRARQKPLATLGLFVKHLFEPLRVYRREGRQDQPHHDVGQREVLGEGCFKRRLGVVHSNLSCGLQPGADAESPAGETPSAAKRRRAQ